MFRRPFVTGRTLPPLRSTNVWPARGGPWCYDQWGRQGRPLVLIPAVLFGRTTWWPAAADLRPHATVVAVDLPGHGGSAHRPRYDPDELVDDLAELVAHLGLRRAPVVVAHGSSAGLAARFAHRYAVHAVVTVDPYRPEHGDPARYLRDMRPDPVPPHLRDLATPVGDPELFAAYRRSMAPSPIGPPAVHEVPGRFAHLAALDCFVRDVRALL